MLSKEMQTLATSRAKFWGSWRWAQKDPAMLQLADDMWAIWHAVWEAAAWECYFEAFEERAPRTLPDPALLFELALSADNALVGLGLQGVPRIE